MSAPEVKEKVVAELKKQRFDFICLNFANADMVGHTGIIEAITKAVETVDACVREVTDTAVENGYSVIITADHGNADYALNEDGSPNTAHTTNPVPVWLIDNTYKAIADGGRLADLAPTILHMMGLPIPATMDGKVLVG
jgi:2,3-bisphosphoglycerate-independent phosphoglycerate mutase